jgi:hypothetical protein
MSVQSELLCTQCQDQAVRISELEAALRSLSDELEARSVELAGARSTQITLERQITKLRTDLSRAAEDDPKSKEIKGLYEYWRVQTGHTRVKPKLTDDRAKLIRSQLRHYTVAQIMEAIDGATLKPYMRFGRRYVYGNPKTERATEIDQCIGKAKYVESNRLILKQAQATAVSNVDLILDIRDHFEALSQAYMGLALNAVCAREKERAGDLVGAAEICTAIAAEEAAAGMVEETV